jgi:hypothetical protein
MVRIVPFLMAALVAAAALPVHSAAPPPRPKPTLARPVPPPAAPAVVEIEDTTEDGEEAACRAEIAGGPIGFVPLAMIEGERNCAILMPLDVRALDVEVALAPPATLNCRTTRALAGWVEQVVRPAAAKRLGTRPAVIHIAGSYGCRSRNFSPGAPLSEHGFGNAVDVSGITMADGTTYAVEALKDTDTPLAAFQREIEDGACGHFTTVLGPGCDSFHSDHLHFDLRRRSGGCHRCR